MAKRKNDNLTAALRSKVEAQVLRYVPADYGIQETLRQPAEIWQAFVDRVAATRTRGIYWEMVKAARKCESPIEELMFLALCTSATCYFDNHATDEYRVDFKVSVFRNDYADKDGKPSHFLWRRGTVMVEVDGHDFHEKTKEQASRDKQKDRALQEAGFRIYRYTGSDIWHRCIDHAEEVLSAAYDLAYATEPVASRPVSRDERE